MASIAANQSIDSTISPSKLDASVIAQEKSQQLDLSRNWASAEHKHQKNQAAVDGARQPMAKKRSGTASRIEG